MTPLLAKMLQIILSSSVLIALVVLFRFVLLRLGCPRGAVLALWTAVGLRLLLPFSIGSPAGVLPELISEDPGRSASSPAPGVFLPEVYNTLVLAVYLAGVLAMLIYYAVSYGKLARMVRRAESLGEGIYVTDEIDEAFLFGIFSPCIILPDGLSDFVRKAVVRHEDEHLRHGDQFWKPLAFFLLAAHWFNPLVWAAYFLFVKDLEFACDDRAAGTLPAAGRRQYAEALLLLGSSSRHGSVQTVAFGEGNVEKRILAVLSPKRPTAILSVFAVALAVVLGVLSMLHHDPQFAVRPAPDSDSVTYVPQEDFPSANITAVPERYFDYTETPFDRGE